MAETGGSCSLCAQEKTGPPLNGDLCPDWKKWAGIPDNLFSLLLLEQEEKRHTDQTLYSSDNCWNIEIFDTYLNKKVENHLQQL